MNLIRKGFIIENLLSSVNRVGDDNDFGDAFLVASLIDSASDSKWFCFSAGDEGCMMNCFDQELVADVDIEIEVAISFLMLASKTTIAVWGDVDA